MEKSRQYKIPVGDYLPMQLAVDVGQLEVGIAQNRFPQGELRETTDARAVYGIKIRQDKPFVLDFAKKPTVVFLAPEEDQTFKPGNPVDLKAILTDPVLDTMVLGLRDTTRLERELSVRDAEGKTVKIPMYASLDPTVVITDSSGKQVAEGKMPFG